MEAATSQPLTSSSSWNTVGLAAGAAMPEGLTVTSSRSSRPTRMGAKSKISPSQMLATDAQDKLTCRSDFMSCVLLGWHSKKDSKNISKQKASNKGPSTSATINDRIQVKSQSAESILLTLLRKTRVKHTKNTQQQMSKHQKNARDNFEEQLLRLPSDSLGCRANGKSHTTNHDNRPMEIPVSSFSRKDRPVWLHPSSKLRGKEDEAKTTATSAAAARS